MNADERADQIAARALSLLGEFGEEAILVFRCGDDIVVSGQGYLSRQLGLTVYAAEHLKLKLNNFDSEDD